MANKYQTTKIRRYKWLTIMAALAGTLILASCGGGGGGTPDPTSVTQTVTCPNGTSKSGTGTTTTTATDAATAQCAGPILVSVTPSNNATAVSPDTFTTLSVATDSTLDLSSISVVNIIVKAGQNAVAGTVAADGTKGFKWTPSAKLAYSQAFTYTANVKDTLGKSLAVAGGFATASVSCIAPQVPSSDGQSCFTPLTCPAPGQLNSVSVCMQPPTAGSTWNVAMKAWVYPVGVLVVGLNTLPQECATIGDSCWTAKIADGTIKLVNTNAIMTGYSTRPVVFAVYKTFDGFWDAMPLYADVPALSTGAGQLVFNGGTSSLLTDVKGSDNGIKMTFPEFGCYERVHTGGGGWGNVQLASCPI